MSSEEADAADFVAAYNGGINFPLAGEAPTITEVEEGIALSITRKPATVNVLDYLAKVTVSDDYTSTSRLLRTFTSVTKDGTEITVDDYSAMVLEEGIYDFAFTITDAYSQSSSSVIRLTVQDEEEPVLDNDIENGDFETGDTSGWSIYSGTCKLDEALSSEETFWAEAIPYNKGGNYFFNGWNAQYAESDLYSVRSTSFTLGGSGQISFKLGGRTAALSVYNDYGDKIATYTNYAFSADNFPNVSEGCMLATMNHYVADLSDYIGENLYIVVEDTGSSDWAVLFFDDVVTYHEETIDVSQMKDAVTQNGVDIDIAWLAASAS